MNCQQIITEYNSKKPCWFPKDPNSPYDLCKRCTFYRFQEMLETISKGDFTEIPSFQDTKVKALVQENQFDSLLSALTTLKRKEDPRIVSLYKTLLDCKPFQSYLLRQIQNHSPGPRCTLYQYCLSKQTAKEAHIYEVPWNCWHCIASILRQKNSSGLYDAFTRGILGINSCRMLKECDTSIIIDCMISLELKRKSHTARLLFDQYRRVIGNEERGKETLHQFLSQPLMIQSVFQKEPIDYYPYVWRKDPTYQRRLEKEVLKNVRKRNWVFKEELMMRTWAPHRLFPWCLDVEELKEFPDEESEGGERGSNVD